MEHPDAAGMKVWEMLLALHYVGRVRTAKLMKTLHLSHERTVAELTERQREALIEATEG